MGKSALLGSFDDVLKMSKAVAGVLPCIDFAHLHARQGDGSFNSYEEWRSILEKMESELGQAALKQMHIHLSGIEYSAKGERNHLPLQESDFDIHSLFAALKHTGAEGRILCESPVLEEDAIYMQLLWRELPE